MSREGEGTFMRFFGLDGEDPMTLKEIGERLGLTRAAFGRLRASGVSHACKQGMEIA